MKKKISRRGFIGALGVGLAHITLVGLSGCEETSRHNKYKMSKRYSVPQKSYTPPVAKREYSRPPVIERPEFVSHPEWTPLRRYENKSKWNAIIIHHTATERGSASLIDKSHRSIGYDGLGYDFVINNGNGNPDGMVEVGYRWRKQLTGAHCRPSGCSDNYWNNHSIGVVMVGNFENRSPSWRQYKSLAEVITFLKDRYDIPDSEVYCHYNVPDASTKCPGRNFSFSKLTRMDNYA